MLAGAAVSLILLTTLGGTTYPWASAPIILLGVIGTVLLVGFVLVERRAAEPVLPLRLFRRDGFLTTNGPNSNGPSGLIVLTDAGRQDRDQLVTARRGSEGSPGVGNPYPGLVDRKASRSPSCRKRANRSPRQDARRRTARRARRNPADQHRGWRPALRNGSCLLHPRLRHARPELRRAARRTASDIGKGDQMIPVRYGVRSCPGCRRRQLLLARAGLATAGAALWAPELAAAADKVHDLHPMIRPSGR